MDDGRWTILVFPLHLHVREVVGAETATEGDGPSSIGTARSGCHAIRNTCRSSEQTRNSCRTGVTTGRAERRNSGTSPRERPGAAHSGEWPVPLLPRRQRASRTRATKGERVVRHGLWATPFRPSERPGDSTSLSSLHGGRGACHPSRRDDDDIVLRGLPPRMGRTSRRCCGRDAHGSTCHWPGRIRRTAQPRSPAGADLHVLCDRRICALHTPDIRRGVLRVRRLRSDVGSSTPAMEHPSSITRVAVISATCPTIR